MKDLLTILQGDALEQLRALPDESVQCCVTSPPYWGLRDYGTAQWEDGDADCDHKQGRTGASNAHGYEVKPSPRNRDGTAALTSGECKRCGAKRIDAQLGIESTPEEYLANMVEVFREVRRVLKTDGTCWLNLGDSYIGGGRGFREEDSSKQATNVGSLTIPPTRGVKGYKPKDLVGIPWMVAFALRADGWWLRSDIIWSKPNPMPESVADRPTKAHEYLFLLTKAPNYYYDQGAIRESPSETDWQSRYDRTVKGHKSNPDERRSGLRVRKPAGWDTGDGAHGSFHREGRALEVEYSELSDLTRNKRSVWTVATRPYPEAHFATYPPDLIKPCILAGSRPGDTVLDPFAGSGTTGMVALELGRKAILIELNPDYCKLMKQRCDVTPGLPI